jgi:lactate permease
MGNVPLSALVAAIPVVVLMVLLGIFHVRAHRAALLALFASLAIAVFIFHMPAKLAGAAAVYGALYGLFPIGWIVLSAIFVYDITVYTGQFEVLKHSIASLGEDRRVQAVLIAFSFGAFMEGAAGFGTPVAISAAMLIGLGFKARTAAGLALIGNTAPVAFGGLGTPIIALGKVTGIPVETLSVVVGQHLSIFSVIIPFWLIVAMCGFKKMWEVWPACLTAGLSFASVQLLVSRYSGPWLVAIAASMASIVAMLVLLQFWKPKTVWRFEHDDSDAALAGETSVQPIPGSGLSNGQSPAPAPEPSPVQVLEYEQPRPRRVWVAWMPWVILSLMVFIWGIPAVKNQFNAWSSPSLEIASLHRQVLRAPPVVKSLKAEEAVFSFNWLSATGTALLLTGIISGSLLGIAPGQLSKVFAHTLYKVRISLLTIVAMLALGYVTRFGGLDATMGLAFAGTGKLFPFFSPLLGWLGVALTGSDTASNILFGNLQQITAGRVGINPVLAAAANSSGGVMGKMIDAQSIVVASVATGQQGHEGTILRDVFFHSLALAILVGILVLIQAYVL